MKSLEPHMHDDDSQFDMLVSAMQRRLATITVLGQPLFTCDSPDLYQGYLDGFAYPDDRQHHTCNCCRQFIERFGNLVVIDQDTGEHKSAIWPDHEVAIPSLFYVSLRNMTAAIAKANVNGVFIAKETLWGTPKAGGFSHFAVTVPAAYVKGNRYLEPHQVMAQKKQDFGTLSHGLADFDINTISTAVSLLESDTLFRSEKFIGPAKFLRELHLRLAKTKNSARRKNMIWHAVATAPVGFATPRSSMIGTLLEDIVAGMDFQSVKKRFAAKADPMQYQRPQAAPTSGNIAQAEKIVEKLGIANSLRRRPARLDEIRGMLWTPKTPGLHEAKQNGIFGHLLPDTRKAPLLASFGSITFEKFKKQVLGNALKIEVFMRDTMDFVGFVTATDPDAPPILQWDIDGKRNPVSWYVYHGGSRPHQWSLRPARWVEVTRIATKPSAWDDPEKFAHFGDSVAFLLKGAADTRKSGLSLFPETLKPELHSIRSTIESFSKNGTLDEGEATANGVLLGKNNGPLTVRVTTELGVVEYLIDRLD